MFKIKLVKPLPVALLSVSCWVLSSVSAAVAMEARAVVVLPPTYGIAEHGSPSYPPFLGESAFEVDGVAQFPMLVQNQNSYSVDVLASNISSADATLAAWIDFNDNKMFDASEAAIAIVVAGSRDTVTTLNWTNLAGITPDFSGQTYSRFRISTTPISAEMAVDAVPDGEVEDYTLFVQADADGNGHPDNTDLMDSDGDGIVNRDDLDSDNDSIPDAVEGTEDSDADGIADYLDLDSDNDGIPDIRESGFGFDAASALDVNNDGRADPWVQFGSNGLADPVETDPDNGILGYTVLDTDGDGSRDTIDIDSDNDGLFDLVEIGGVDSDDDGRVDPLADSDLDGIADSVDASITGAADSDGDGIVDTADVDLVMEGDADMDNIVDLQDPDSNGDGFADSLVRDFGEFALLPDANSNDIPDFLDARGKSGPIETGLKGSSGCSISSNPAGKGVDPLLPLLVLLAAFWVRRRRVCPIR